MAKCTTTIEQIKKESLKRLGVVLSDDIKSASISELMEMDETYAQYLRNMDEPINAAIMRIVQADVLPLRTYRLAYADTKKYPEGISVNGPSMFVSVEKLIPDVREIKQIDLYAPMGGIYPDVDYGVLSENDIALPILRKGEQYVFHYAYMPQTISPFMELSEAAKAWKNEMDDGESVGEGAYNKNVLDIPNELANIIPYFVFGELYMHDEPTVAMYQGTNKFEAYLSTYTPPQNTRNNRINNIFGGFN